ncbi:MAG: hypothetical protein D6729_12300 [Deltaproteobacteria bacterium]|nr:MAG: hypothetical protein D6729_12300 [Deltaproteobacteria bacterium]
MPPGCYRIGAMREHPSLRFASSAARPLALLLLVASACGGGGGNGQGGDGGSKEPTDFEYFGLTPGRCFGFRGGLAGAQEMTLGVEEENDALGFVTRQIRYRLGGILQRVDYVTAEEGQLRLHRREYRGSVEVSFDPPAVLLERPVYPTGTTPLTTETTATDVSTEESSTWTFRISVTEPQDVTVEERPEPYHVFPIFAVVDRGDTMQSEQDEFEFSEEGVWTRLDLDGDAFPEGKLVKIWDTEPGTSCGTIP